MKGFNIELLDWARGRYRKWYQYGAVNLECDEYSPRWTSEELDDE
jgi:hypothetical protein